MEIDLSELYKNPYEDEPQYQPPPEEPVSNQCSMGTNCEGIKIWRNSKRSIDNEIKYFRQQVVKNMEILLKKINELESRIDLLEIK